MSNRDTNGAKENAHTPHWMHLVIGTVAIFAILFLIVDGVAASYHGQRAPMWRNLALAVGIAVFIGLPTVIHGIRRQSE